MTLANILSISNGPSKVRDQHLGGYPGSNTILALSIPNDSNKERDQHLKQKNMNQNEKDKKYTYLKNSPSKNKKKTINYHKNVLKGQVNLFSKKCILTKSSTWRGSIRNIWSPNVTNFEESDKKINKKGQWSIKKNHDWEDQNLKNISFRIKHKIQKYYLKIYEDNTRRNRNINLKHKKGYVDLFDKRSTQKQVRGIWSTSIKRAANTENAENSESRKSQATDLEEIRNGKKIHTNQRPLKTYEMEKIHKSNPI